MKEVYTKNYLEENNFSQTARTEWVLETRETNGQKNRVRWRKYVMALCSTKEFQEINDIIIMYYFCRVATGRERTK